MEIKVRSSHSKKVNFVCLTFHDGGRYHIETSLYDNGLRHERVKQTKNARKMLFISH